MDRRNGVFQSLKWTSGPGRQGQRIKAVGRDPNQLEGLARVSLPVQDQIHHQHRPRRQSRDRRNRQRFNSLVGNTPTAATLDVNFQRLFADTHGHALKDLGGSQGQRDFGLVLQQEFLAHLEDWILFVDFDEPILFLGLDLRQPKLGFARNRFIEETQWGESERIPILTRGLRFARVEN